MQDQSSTPDTPDTDVPPTISSNTPSTPDASLAAESQPYLNEPPTPPQAPRSAGPQETSANEPVINEMAYYNTGADSGAPQQPAPPAGRNHGEFANDEQYIHDTPYPYEPARNDPRAALNRPPSEYTPNLESSAAADQQMHSYVFEQEHHNERGPAANAWVKLTDLIGRPLLDLENGRKLGNLDNLVLTRDYGFVAAFVVQDATVPPPIYPARGATIGEDAIVIPAASLQNFDPISFRGMPLARRLIGKKLVTAGGKVVGGVTDVRFDPVSDAAFLQIEDEGNILQRLMRQATTLPTAAIQTFGQDVLIIGEGAARQYFGDRMR